VLLLLLVVMFVVRLDNNLTILLRTTTRTFPSHVRICNKNKIKLKARRYELQQ
jgi:hypothetical protein